MDTTKRWRLYKDVLDDQFTGSLINTTLVGIIFSCSEERRALVWSAIILVNVFLLGVWAWLGRNAADFVTRSYVINPPIALQIVEKLIGTHGWQYRTEVRSYTRLFHLQEHGITIRMYPIVRNPLGATVTNIYIGPKTAANAPFIEMLQIKLDQDLTPHGLV